MAEDFDLTVTGRELEPYVKKGAAVRAVRCTRLADGEVGLLLWRGQPLLRQYCEDSEGNIYLFTVNRRLKRDLRVPKGEPVYCFARLLLPELPLPDPLSLPRDF